MIIKLLLITITVSLIVDISGIIDSIKYAISKFLKCEPHQIRLKPFDCSLCMSFWTEMAYLIYNNNITLVNITLAILFACYSSLVSEIYYTIKDIIIKVLVWINKL